MENQQLKQALEFIKNNDKETKELGISIIEENVENHFIEIVVLAQEVGVVITEDCPKFKKAVEAKFGAASPGLQDVINACKTDVERPAIEQWFKHYLNAAFEQAKSNVKIKEIKIDWDAQ